MNKHAIESDLSNSITKVRRDHHLTNRDLFPILFNLVYSFMIVTPAMRDSRKKEAKLFNGRMAAYESAWRGIVEYFHGGDSK